MKRALAAVVASSWMTVIHAQSVPAPIGAPPPKPPASSSESSTSATQPPRRDTIAPILDIRIQDDGIRLPTPREDAPQEKPPAK